MKIGRNDPCSCGSGRKFKHCCMKGRADLRAGVAPPDGQVNQNLQLALNHLKTGQPQQTEIICSRILQLHPDHPDALHLLGLACRAQGDTPRAIGYLRRAAELHPVAPIFFNLGNACQAQGDLEQAIACYDRALQLTPSHLASRNNLAMCLRQTGRLTEAVNQLRIAVQACPDSAELCSNLGDALCELGELDEARAILEEALKISPDFAKAHLNLGSVLNEMRLVEPALRSFGKALELDPADAEAHLVMANALRSVGDFAAAKQHVDQALTINPGHPRALSVPVFLQKMTINQRGWADTAISLCDTAMPDHDRVFLLYALGKYFDDVKQYDRAFHYFEWANRLQRRHSGGLNVEAARARMSRIITATDTAYWDRPLPGVSHSHRPVFIIGMPRSGTSLLEQVLASHPAIHGAGELRYWDRAVSRHFPDGGVTGETGRYIAETVRGYEAELERHSTEALRVVDKMPGNFWNVGVIHALFPAARFIHMHRNPVDTCLSIYFQHFQSSHAYANDLNDLVAYHGCYRELMAHWTGMLPAGTLMDIRYEDMLAEPATWARKVIQFIGLDWDERCLEFHLTERRVGTSSDWQVRQPLYRTSVERWRHYADHVTPLLSLMKDDPS